MTKFPLRSSLRCATGRTERSVGIGSSGSPELRPATSRGPESVNRTDILDGESRGRDPDSGSVRRLAGFRPGRLGELAMQANPSRRYEDRSLRLVDDERPLVA